MRICLLTPEYPPAGGIGTYVRDLAGQLYKLGENVRVCGVGIHAKAVETHTWGKSFSLPPLNPTALEKAERQILARLGKLPLIWQWCKALNKNRVESRVCRSAAKQIASYIKAHEDEFDVIEIPNWPGHGAFLVPKRAKLVVRLSSPANECGMPAKAILNLEAATCRNADLIIGNSNAILNKTKDLYGLDLAKALVIPHGISDVIASGKIARRDDGLDFLYVGRSEHRKGTDILLSSLPDLFEKFPSSRVTFIGTNLDRLLELTTAGDWLVSKCKAGQIRCLGKVAEQEKLDLYSTSHWIVIPSRFESFGLVAIESLRAGTPFIAAASGGLVETGERSAESIMVAPNTVDAWRAVLLHVATKGVDFAERLRSRCREDFESFFTAKRMAQESLRVYAQLLS